MSITQKETKIGAVKLVYGEDGNLLMAGFSPRIEITFEDLKDQLGDCTNRTDQEIKDCAQLLLASFFNKVSNIELRDVEKTTIETQIAHVEKYSNNSLKNIELEFIYKEN